MRHPDSSCDIHAVKYFLSWCSVTFSLIAIFALLSPTYVIHTHLSSCGIKGSSLPYLIAGPVSISHPFCKKSLLRYVFLGTGRSFKSTDANRYVQRAPEYYLYQKYWFYLVPSSASTQKYLVLFNSVTSQGSLLC